MKNAKKPIVVRPSIRLGAGAKSPSQPAKTAATSPTYPIHRGSARVCRMRPHTHVSHQRPSSASLTVESTVDDRLLDDGSQEILRKRSGAP
jgi:hypothetical protein